MSTSRGLRELFFARLSKQMAAEGFRLNKSLERYIRKEGAVEFQYWALTSVRPDGSISVDPGVAVRHDAVEDLYHRCSRIPAKWQKHSPTYSIDLWRWMARERGLPDNAFQETFIQIVTCEETAGSAAAELFAFYKLFACLFYERYGELHELARLFGDRLGDQLYGLPVRNLCTGLILAKLAGRPDFERICNFASMRVSSLGDSVSVSIVECLIKELTKEG